MHRNALVAFAAAGVVFLASYLPVQREAVAQKKMSLTAMDYVEIQQLVNKLSFALDYCTNGGQDFANLFVDGGAFTVDNGDGKPTQMSTREALIELAAGPDCTARAEPPASYILHLSEGLVIEPTADGARGQSYAIYPAKAGKYLREDVAGQLGIYHDEYVKTADGWRFKSRRHETMPALGKVAL